MNVSYEFSDLSAELLPAREALGGFNVSNIWAENTAVAINHGDGDAVANAQQDIDVDQNGDHGHHGHKG